MKKLILILSILLVTPGCLAAAIAGHMYARGQRNAARIEYISTQKAAGKTDAQILESIKALDPAWYAEIQKQGGLAAGGAKK